jgi:hypothetical protein
MILRNKLWRWEPDLKHKCARKISVQLTR